MIIESHDSLGEQVYVTGAYPDGLTLREFHALPLRVRQQHAWRPMVRGWFDATQRDPTEPKLTATNQQHALFPPLG